MATPPVRVLEPALTPGAASKSALRRPIALACALLISVPLALTLAGSGQAAPTLTIQQAQAELDALQTQEDAATEAYDAGRIAATNASQQAQAAEARVAAQNRALAVMEKGIASFAVASYTDSSGDTVETLLAGGDPEELVQRASAIDQIALVHGDQLIAIQAQREALLAAQQTAADQQAAALASLAKVAAAKAAVDKVIAQEQAVLSHLQAQQRDALAAQQAAAEAASRSLARAALAQGPATAGPVPSASGAAAAALSAAYSQLGKPYSYGAAGPNAYDCSGLTMWAYAHAGISLPHSAAAQMGYGTPVSRDELEPGDLVFFDDGGHVGIYVGGGDMIDANHTGGFVGVRPLYGNYDGAVRL